MRTMSPMERNTLYKAKRMSDGTDIVGYLIVDPCYTYMIDINDYKSIDIDGRNEVIINNLKLTRVLSRDITKANISDYI